MFFNGIFEEVTAFRILQKHSGRTGTLRKKNSQYMISFIGEPGIDNGGVFREFYSGLFKFGSINVF